MTNVVSLNARSNTPLDKKGLARHLGCSTRTIENRMREGMPTLGPDRFGRQRYDLAAVEAWMGSRDRIARDAAWDQVEDPRFNALEDRVAALEARLRA
jgi:phage terminase Nu1 subunit (DNA packaging protein)